MKKTRKTWNCLLMAVMILWTLSACAAGNAVAPAVKQTAERAYQVNGQTVLVTVDLSGGWSVSFASGAVYLYEHAEKEAVAFGYPLNEAEYNEHAADCRGYEDCSEVDGTIRASDGDGEYTSSWYLFPVGGGAYFMVVADNMVDGAKADVEGVFSRFDVKLDGEGVTKK